MNHNDRLDDLIARIKPFTPEEQQEILLEYFTAILGGLDADGVVALRAHLCAKFPAGPEQTTITEVIDGHLALRAIKGSD